MKLLGFLAVSLLAFLAIVSWPALRSDWDYWRASRAYGRLRIGEPKARVESIFHRPPFAAETDQCWVDHEQRWPGGGRVYTLCFDRGRLVSKSVDGG